MYWGEVVDLLFCDWRGEVESFFSDERVMFARVVVLDPFGTALYVSSSNFDWQNLGIKDSIAVELTSVRPNTELGRWKPSIVYRNTKSFFGTEPSFIVNES